jgi:hypothetical protein
MININQFFIVELLNASNVKIGMVYNFTNLNIKESLNEIGKMSIVIDLAELPTDQTNLVGIYAIQLVPTGFSNVTGLAASYKFIVDSTDISVDQLNVTFECSSEVIELSYAQLRSSLKYSQQVPTTLINTFLSEVSWTGSVVGTPPNNAALDTIWEGESRWSAINLLRKWTGGWFRWEGGKTLYHGQFNADISGVTPDINFTYNNSGSFENVPNNNTLQGIRLTEKINKGQIINRLVPLGGGVYAWKNASGVKYAEGPINLGYSNRTTPYTRTFASGVTDPNNWYIEDSASVSTYGRRSATFPYSEIKPISLSDADMTNAANTLYDISAYYLKRYKDPQYVYELQLTGYNVRAIKIGQCIRVQWYGSVNSIRGKTVYKSIDKKFYIIGIDWDYSNSSEWPVATLTLSTNGEDIQDVVDIISDLVVDTKKVNVRTQPSITYKTQYVPPNLIGYEYKYNTSTFGAGSGGVYTNPNDYRFTYIPGAEVSVLNEVYIDIFLVKPRFIVPQQWGWSQIPNVSPLQNQFLYVNVGESTTGVSGNQVPFVFGANLIEVNPLIGNSPNPTLPTDMSRWSVNVNSVAVTPTLIANYNDYGHWRITTVSSVPLADYIPLAFGGSWRTSGLVTIITPLNTTFLFNVSAQVIARQTILPYIS